MEITLRPGGDWARGCRARPTVQQSRSLPVLLPRQHRSWLANPSNARTYEIGSLSTARSSQPSARPAPRSEVFFDAVDRRGAAEEFVRSTAFSSGKGALSTAGQLSVSPSCQRPDMGLLHNMGYHGPLYTTLNHADKREALCRAQREGELNQFRSALRAAQLHIGVDDPQVLQMRNILKEADWAVRTCRQCSMLQLMTVLSRTRELDLGPRLWAHPELAAARAKYAAWKSSSLRSTDEETRKNACDALCALGEAASKHAPDLATCLGDESYEVTSAASLALQQMGQAGAAATASKLNDRRMKVRKSVCVALGKMGVLGAAHAGAVELALQDLELEVRRDACLAFEAFGIDGAAYATAVAACVADSDAGVRRAACRALASMGKAAVSHADAITLCLRDEDVSVQAAAQIALISISEATPTMLNIAGAD